MSWYKTANILKDVEDELWASTIDQQYQTQLMPASKGAEKPETSMVDFLSIILSNNPESLDAFFKSPNVDKNNKAHVVDIIANTANIRFSHVIGTLKMIISKEKQAIDKAQMHAGKISDVKNRIEYVKAARKQIQKITDLKNEFYEKIRMALNKQPTLKKYKNSHPEVLVQRFSNMPEIIKILLSSYGNNQKTFLEHMRVLKSYIEVAQEIEPIGNKYLDKVDKIKIPMWF